MVYCICKHRQIVNIVGADYSGVRLLCSTGWVLCTNDHWTLSSSLFYLTQIVKFSYKCPLSVTVSFIPCTLLDNLKIQFLSLKIHDLKYCYQSTIEIHGLSHARMV